MLNVIIVDDELLMRIGLKSMIPWEEHGFVITGEAQNGKEALELAQRQAPDLIITDIKMPVMDGLELIRKASSGYPACQFIILSCLDEFQYAQEAVRLGATDYLIKSDLKQEHLQSVLGTVRKKAAQFRQTPENSLPTGQYKEGIGYLKETLFKELFSGFRDDSDIMRSKESLQISLTPEDVVIAKLRINHFHELRRKYVEQDEKLLRYSIVNIMEEIVPRRWNKEIIVENSSDYLLIMNLPDTASNRPAREILGPLLGKIVTAMQEFLNISISVGVSGVSSGYGGLRKAYREADAALANLFFEPVSDVLYYDSPAGRMQRSRDSFLITREESAELRRRIDVGNAEADLDRLRRRLYDEGVTEQGCRKAYMRILALISSCFPSVPELLAEGQTPYEHMLYEEKLEGLHSLAIRFLRQSLNLNRALVNVPQSYANQAKAIILERYAEDISLQTVAGQINVNPSYLSRVFKEETGENFIGYLTRIRIEKAKQLLKSKAYKVYEVASLTGYPNTAYFSKLFKKATGVTPEEYRG
ncbi:response regulator [Paenibacillus nanensis]|uniref:Response regulator n=1 Tax=Paenibacillus nanensis TaxID=393251 RepID=A0A3A1VHA6_9BACL|nr:response regulator [Paenibacillus nanensis]RIX59645.1 response regulator [Paenibacillus nanensis]